MKVSIDVVELKKESKKLLDGNTWVLFLCNVCFLGILALVGSVVFFIPNPLEKILTNLVIEKGFANINLEWIVWGFFMFIRSIIFVAFVYPFYVCLSTVPLAIVNNEEIEVSNIFKPICKVRYFVEYAVAGVQKYLFTILWFLVLIFPSIVAYYRYSFTKYILATENDTTAGDAIRKSKNLTYGNKSSMFSIDLSFIGWLFIGIITCGVGLIFVIGYHEVVCALQYKKILQNQIVEKVENQ